MFGVRLKRGGILLAVGAVALLALVAGACSSDPSDDEIVDELVDFGLTEDQARCMVDELGGDAGRLFAAEDEDDVSEEDAEKLFDAVAACIDV